MSTLYAHIGAEKCGSSLIEYAFLSAPQFVEILANSGVVSMSRFHTALRKQVLSRPWDGSVHGRIKAQLLTPQRMTGKDVFISEELLLNLTHEQGQSNQLEEKIDFAKQLFDGFENVQLMLVIRRQDKFIESHYNQLVKRGETQDFQSVFAGLPLDNYRWDVIADAWGDEFGKENLHIIPFESSVLATSGGPKSSLSAIFNVIGIDVDVPLDAMPIVNPSLRPELLNAQRLINDEFDSEIAERISDILAKEVLKVPGAVQGLLSPEQRQGVLDFFAESNKRLFEEYISECSVEEYLTV